MYSAAHIAHYFLTGPGRNGRFGVLTNMKLQKLVYYTKVWSLIDGNNIVHESIYRWEHGPVSSDLYRILKKNGKSEIPTIEGAWSDLDPHAALIADIVMYTYGRLSAFELSDLTHSEDPWSSTLPNNEITSHVITEYYSKHPFAVNFPVGDDRPFHPLMTQSAYAFTFDMTEDTRNSMGVYASFTEYKHIVDLTLEAGSVFRRS